MADTLPQRIEAGGKWVIENGSFQDPTLMIGGLCYIEQGESLIVLEPTAALAMADKMTAWAAAALRAKDRADGE